MTPGEALLDVLLGFEALHELDNLEIGHIDLRVLGGIEILLGIQHTLLEQILIDLHTVLLRNQHPASSLRPTARWQTRARSMQTSSDAAETTTSAELEERNTKSSCRYLYLGFEELGRAEN